MVHEPLDYIDEAPFILALEANPADDGARLAYADWLEERGSPRADYLRALTKLLPGLTGDVATYTAGVVLPRVDHYWRHDVDGAFDVELVGFDEPATLGVVQALRDLKHCDLAWCVDTVNRCRQRGPAPIACGVTLGAAVEACRALARCRCLVALRRPPTPRACDLAALAGAALSGSIVQERQWRLPHGLLAHWRTNWRRPELHCNVFSGESGSFVIDGIAAIDLFARTSGLDPRSYSSEELAQLFRHATPRHWYLAWRDGDELQIVDDGVDFTFNDGIRGWLLKCEFRPTGCRVSFVGRGQEVKRLP